MNKTLTVIANFLLLLTLGFTSQAAIAATYDLSADWSDSSNPNGAWSYEVLGVLGTTGTRTGDTFTSPPPIWGTGGNVFVGWSKSNGTEQFPSNWSSGDVFGHSSSVGASIAIAWTSPSDGTADIAGIIAEGRAIGRSNDWVLTLNGVDIWSIGGTLTDANQSDPFSKTTNISAGDTLRIEVRANSSFGDYVYFEDFTIDLAPVPIPAAAWMFGSALLGLGVVKRRKA